MDYKDCRQLGTVTPTENKKKFTINNPNKRDVYRVKVDGCLITEGRKCDYLFGSSRFRGVATRCSM